VIVRLLFVASLLLAGCGTSVTQATTVATPQPATASIGLLPASAAPWLPAVTHRFSAGAVSKESTVPGLAGRLEQWGYTGGWDRTFQGESRRLTFVDSQLLTFRARAGATAFVAYLHGHVGDFFPLANVQPLSIRGRSGWTFEPPECACHMANPYWIGVVTSGRDVFWLAINGPLATSGALRSLLGKIPAGASAQ